MSRCPLCKRWWFVCMLRASFGHGLRWDIEHRNAYRKEWSQR